MKTIGILGTGLIGGSMALSLRNKNFAAHFIGTDYNESHQQEALSKGLVDEMLPLAAMIQKADMIIIAIPVDASEKLIEEILHQAVGKVVMDVGSTKLSLCKKIAMHPNRTAFVATHPMWGTEYSGPLAAVDTGFKKNAVVICDQEKSGKEAIEAVESLYEALEMKIVYMNAAAHDLHAAYVSHISHITSFALANTVLEKEKEDSAIFEMASGGFESTVRLAKSNPEMWLPIFMENRENVLDVLNEHIAQLKKFRSCLEKDNYKYMRELIENANKIKRIIK